MKNNQFKFRVNYAGDIKMTNAVTADSECGSPYDVSETFRKMMFKTLCNMLVQNELVINVTLIPHAES